MSISAFRPTVRHVVSVAGVLTVLAGTPSLGASAISFNADGVSLTAPRVTTVGTNVTIDWSVTTSKPVSFRYLQLHIPVAGDTGYNPNTTVTGTRNFTSKKTINPGTYTALVAYSRNGTTFVNGPKVTFTVKADGTSTTTPAPSTPAPSTPAPSTPAPTTPAPGTGSFAADGVRLTAPKSSVSGNTVTTTWTVDTNKSVSFRYLQLASPSGDGGYNPSTTINGSRTFTTTRTMPNGTHTQKVAYSLGGAWTIGPTETFTVGGTTTTPPATTTPVTPPATTTPVTPPTTTTPVVKPNTSRPSGMPFDSGMYHSNNPALVQQLSAARGRQMDVITLFAARESWPNMHNTWYFNTIPADFKGTISMALPMWPENGNITAATNGSYNAEWEKMGRTLASKYPNAYVRIGWEMNLPNGWNATATNKAQWVKAFQLASTNLKKGGPNLRVVFNPNEGGGQTGFASAADVWPGDEYVDVVGVDSYDWWPAITNDAAWKQHRDGQYGLNWWLNFAKAHNKPFALPEWGLAHQTSAGGDNPLYFDYMYGWMKENSSAMAYEAYYNEPMAFIQGDLLTQNPKGRASYVNWMRNKF